MTALRVQNESRRSHAQGRASMRARGTRLEPQTSPVPLITEADVAEGLSAALIPFSAKQIAKATRKSIEAAKAWKAGERCPNTANARNLARSFPSVSLWLADEFGWAPDARAYSTDTVIRWATEFRNAPGQDGAIARAVLREAGTYPSKEIGDLT